MLSDEIIAVLYHRHPLICLVIQHSLPPESKGKAIRQCPPNKDVDIMVYIPPRGSTPRGSRLFVLAFIVVFKEVDMLLGPQITVNSTGPQW
ncbi:hypothetical protein NPIL_525351 [Nephila pilipes]|uniref:Uncharacterized protein n=1 Tax=Nephila pilipes TaxID=299642 RepID=A0A8X6NMJ3_NEPPI|nr:hypothetical protein NPIL_525351 [Nephila pilipes]